MGIYMKGGAVVFRHENNQKYTVKGVSTTVKESIIDGDLGMSFKYLKKVGDEFYRIQGKFENGKYQVSIKKGDDESTQEVDEKSLLAMLKKQKELAFVLEYLTKLRKKYSAKGGKRKKKSKKSKKSKKKSKK